MAGKRQTGPLRNELRIIGGRWRGRRLQFPPLPDIRPTLDRVRETLFNWLQFEIAGRRCLDLFAGSGALGLEALSRGAGKVVFVDREPAIGRHLRDTLVRLQAQDDATVCLADAAKYLRSPPTPFDVVFLDPPFTQELLPGICRTLEEGGWLANPAFIYIEAPSRAGPPMLPQGWKLLKSKRAGEVGYHLARREGAPGAEPRDTP